MIGVALLAVGAAGADAFVQGQHNPANQTVLEAASAPGTLPSILAQTGSPLPVGVAWFGSVAGLALLAAIAVVLVTWTACRFTDDLHRPFADVLRVIVVVGSACGILALAALDVRTALVLALAVTAWRDLQDFTLRGVVQSGFYGGLLLAAAVLVQPTAVCWALSLALACFLLPGRTRPRAERAAGALVVAFPAVAIACTWAVARILLGGSWTIGVPAVHPMAFAAGALAGLMLWLSLARTGRAAVGAATIPVLLAGSAGVLGPGLMATAIPIAAGVSVIALTVAAHWAAVRVTVVGLAAATALLGSVSTAVTGVTTVATARSMIATQLVAGLRPTHASGDIADLWSPNAPGVGSLRGPTPGRPTGT